jgi:hypothetical protein
MTPDQQATDDAARADGCVPGVFRPVTYKRYSAGVCRLYSRIDGVWLLVAKRTGGGPWRGVPNLAARRKALRQ